MNNVQYKYWRNGFVKQHNTKDIAKSLDGIFQYSKVKLGDINKKQGDIVIVNLIEPDDVSFNEYIKYLFAVEKIEQDGIYTNLFFSKKFFQLVNEVILNT